MTILLLVGLLLVIYLDAETLRKQNQEFYKEVLQYTPSQWTLLFILLSPIYLTRRYQFLQQRPTVVSSDEQIGGTQLAEHQRLSQITEATGIIVTWVAMMFWGMIIYELVAELYAISFEELEEALLASVSSLLLMTFLIYRINQKTSKERFFVRMGLVKKGISYVKLIVLPLVMGISLASISVFIVLNRPQMPLTPLSEVLEKTKSPTALWLFLAVATLVAPFLEELIFRGYFFSVIRRFKGRFFAICLIGGVFAFLHMGQYWGDWLAIFIVGILGFLLTFLREWTGSTISSTIAHYAYNLFVVLLPLVFFFSSSPSYVKYQALFHMLDEQNKEKLLSESIKQNPEFPDAFNDLAWLYAQNDRNLDEALGLIEQALQQDPDNGAYLDTKAEVLYRLGRFKEAIEIESGLVKKAPEVTIFKQQLEKFKRSPQENPETENKRQKN